MAGAGKVMIACWISGGGVTNDVVDILDVVTGMKSPEYDDRQGFCDCF
jgi:hypothetical protein